MSKLNYIEQKVVLQWFLFFQHAKNSSVLISSNNKIDKCKLCS